MVIFFKWYIYQWEIWIQLPRKSISRNERSQFIVENTSQWQKQSKPQDCPSRKVACWQIFLTDKALFFSSHSINLKTRSACVLVAGTQRFFLAGVAKYCSVSQDVTHNELCKWLNKNGPPKNFAKSGTDKLFLYDERKNNHFVTGKDESNEYSEKSWALFDNFFL